MAGNGRVVLVTLVVVQICTIAFGGRVKLEDCSNPTQCDTLESACTISRECFGSTFNICLGQGECNTFRNHTQTYCRCNECYGRKSTEDYICSCMGPPDLFCPTDHTLITCKSRKAPGVEFYSCCLDAYVCDIWDR